MLELQGRGTSISRPRNKTAVRSLQTERVCEGPGLCPHIPKSEAGRMKALRFPVQRIKGPQPSHRKALVLCLWSVHTSVLRSFSSRASVSATLGKILGPGSERLGVEAVS